MSTPTIVRDTRSLMRPSYTPVIIASIGKWEGWPAEAQWHSCPAPSARRRGALLVHETSQARPTRPATAKAKRWNEEAERDQKWHQHQLRWARFHKARVKLDVFLGPTEGRCLLQSCWHFLFFRPDRREVPIAKLLALFYSLFCRRYRCKVVKRL